MSNKIQIHPPKIVLVVNDTTPSSRIENAKRQGVSILEVRVDQFQKWDLPHVREQFRRFKSAGLPLLGTVRSPREGGNPALPAARRAALILEIIPLADWVDLELSSQSILPAVTSRSRKHKTGLVLSFHDFHKMPSLPFLEKLLECSKPHRPALVKIAAHAKSADDVRRLLEFTLKHRARGLVTIAMGPLGALSRVFFGSAGSVWTYTFLTKSSAPGQLPLKELAPLIRRFYP